MQPVQQGSLHKLPSDCHTTCQSNLHNTFLRFSSSKLARTWRQCKHQSCLQHHQSNVVRGTQPTPHGRPEPARRAGTAAGRTSSPAVALARCWCAAAARPGPPTWSAKPGRLGRLPAGMLIGSAVRWAPCTDKSGHSCTDRKHHLLNHNDARSNSVHAESNNPQTTLMTSLI